MNVSQLSDDYEGMRAAMRRRDDAEALIATQLSGDEQLARLLKARASSRRAHHLVA